MFEIITSHEVPWKKQVPLVPPAASQSILGELGTAPQGVGSA